MFIFVHHMSLSCFKLGQLTPLLPLPLLQVDSKFLRNMRFAKKHNKKGQKAARKAAREAVQAK